MPNGPLATVLTHLRRITAPAGREPASDADLLTRYALQRDADAFELLVWRHAGLVWGVCRRVLRRAPDAEDAFQATFLILARKARSVRRGGALAGWLHRVALRVAVRARAAAARRSAAELPDGL